MSEVGILEAGVVKVAIPGNIILKNQALDAKDLFFVFQKMCFARLTICRHAFGVRNYNNDNSEAGALEADPLQIEVWGNTLAVEGFELAVY